MPGKLKRREKTVLELLLGELFLLFLVLFTPPLFKDHTVLKAKGGGGWEGLQQKT